MLTRFLPGLQTREETLKRPELVLALLDEAYEKRTWHGPKLRQSIRGVTVKQAAWRPGPRRHNIWEVTVHAAYWKYAVRRRLTGEKRGSFALKGSNWFLRPVGKRGADNERTWEEDVRLLSTNTASSAPRSRICRCARSSARFRESGTRRRTPSAVL